MDRVVPSRWPADPSDPDTSSTDDDRQVRLTGGTGAGRVVG
ncbi:hypothetical protein O7614_28240 [Micromonospora sp. WMMD961]|nr:hypothetical protein [Micromonospora sp. WMMD961]MDG4783549.1 hypothetical protein [Micromonospora sp. WMMD961]